MACPLLDKLPPELRTKVYEYVLYFEDVPLRHVKQLQPFVKKLTGIDGELPFLYEDPKKRKPELEWIMCDEELFGNGPLTNTAVLSTCKTIYTEAIKIFYDQNIISVDVELFKLENVECPAGSDLSLAKRLLITLNGTCDELQQYTQEFNCINLGDLFTRCEATFPSLQSIVVHTDGTTLPSTTLFEAFLACYNLPAIVTDVDFLDVGCFVASTQSGLTLTVKFKELVELWEEISDLSFRSRMRALHGFGVVDAFLADRTHQAFLSRLVFESSGDDTTGMQMDRFRKKMALRFDSVPETFHLNDHAWWTHCASPYKGYDDSGWSSLWLYQ